MHLRKLCSVSNHISLQVSFEIIFFDFAGCLFLELSPTMRKVRWRLAVMEGNYEGL